MCFKNLPIEFDPDGKARLKQGLEDPWGLRRTADRAARDQAPAPLSAGGQRAVMRSVGAHAFGVIVTERRRPLAAPIPTRTESSPRSPGDVL